MIQKIEKLKLIKFIFLTVLTISLISACDKSNNSKQSSGAKSTPNTSITKEHFSPQKLKSNCIPNGILILKKEVEMPVDHYERVKKKNVRTFLIDFTSHIIDTYAVIQYNNHEITISEGLKILGSSIPLHKVDFVDNLFSIHKGKEKRTVHSKSYKLKFTHEVSSFGVDATAAVPPQLFDTSKNNKFIKSKELKSLGISQIKICSQEAENMSVFSSKIDHELLINQEQVFRVQIGKP